MDLTATEAAARLGVKKQTVYAYVSRGLLDRTVAMDGRTSLFDAAQIDRLRTRHRQPAQGEVASVISSSITRLVESGHQYRDQPVIDLVTADLDFEEVAELLWNVTPADAPEDRWNLNPDDFATLRTVQAALNDDTPTLDRLRVAVATLSASDSLRHDLNPDSMAAAGRRMLSGMVVALPKQHLGPRNRLADQLWLSLATGAGTSEQRRVLNSALVLLADHGLAASTFTARVAASVRADAYSVVSAGLGTVGGVLHGAASSAVHHLINRADAIGADRALGEELAAGRRIPGIGHTVYTERDPREEVLLDLIRLGWADDPRLETLLEMRRLTTERFPKPPNIDFALGALTWLGHMDSSAEALFAIARTAGWVAHAMEEFDERPVRFRPVARYIGPRIDSGLIPIPEPGGD